MSGIAQDPQRPLLSDSPFPGVPSKIADEFKIAWILFEAELHQHVYFVHASGVEAAYMHKGNGRPPCRKLILKLPDLDHAKSAVLNSLSSPHSRGNYKFAGAVHHLVLF